MPRLARRTLAAFLLAFLLSRVLVLLIMTRRMPDLFLHIGQTHVHHLNYGIFLLSAVGGWLLFSPPRDERGRGRAAIIYGVGLALTFDEFGMWLHLGGSYWQRASYDAIVIVSALLTLIGYAPALRHFRAREWIISASVLALIAAVGALVYDHLQHTGAALQRIERAGPE
jgi:hypothetical protein